MSTKLSLKEVSQILGVSNDTVRRWEKKGIIRSERTAGGHRRFEINEVEFAKSKKEIHIPKLEFVKIIGNPLIPSKPAIWYRLMSFVVVSYSLIFIAQNPTVLADAIKGNSLRPSVLGVSSTGGSGVTLASTLDSNFNLSIKGVINTGGISDKAYNAFATSTQSPVKTSVISSSNDLFIGGDLEVAGTINPTGFTNGSIPFINSSGSLAQDNTGLFYDATNRRVGVGTVNPQGSLHIYGTDPAASAKGLLIVEGTGRANIILKPASSFSQIDASGGVASLPFYITNDSGPLVLRADTATEIMRLTSGKVGIGTTSPTQALHVSGGTDGTIEIDGAPGTVGASFKALNTSSNKSMSMDASGGLGRLRTDFSLMSFITSSGEVGRWNGANLGIGTTAATQKLQVTGGNIAIDTTTAGAWDRWIGVNANNSLAIDPNIGTMIASSVDMQFFIDADANQSSRSFQWRTDGNANAAGTELMRLTDTGNLGIGTNSPTEKLHISKTASGSTFVGLLASNLGTADSTETRLVFQNGGWGSGIYTTGIGSVRTNTGGAGTQDLAFYANSIGQVGSEKMRIQGGGNVGIGTTSPTSLFHTTGAVTGKALSIFNETGDQALLTASASGVAKFTVQHSGLVDATADGSSTKVVAGAIVDGSYTGTVVDGLTGVDSSDGRFYFRYGGAWHYVAQSAGFQIPNYETFAYNFDTKSFETNTPLKDGDFLIPFAEKRLSDGAVHGLYARMKDVADKIFKDVELAVNSLLTNKIVISNASDTTKSTIGVGKVLSGTKEINISNENVNDKSLIYITPTTSTSNHTVYIKAQSNGSFTVGFDDVSDKDVSFNWWIVEAQK